jgi:competence protein ComEC
MLLLWCLLGAWCAEMEPQPSPSLTVAALSDGLMRTVEGTIVNAGPLRRELEINFDEPGAESPTQRVDLRVASIESVTNTEDTQIPGDGGVRLTVNWPQVFGGQAIPQTFRCGEHVRAEIQLLPPQEYRDPGVWSRTEYLLDQGITSTASVKVERIKSLGQDGNRPLACRLAEWQRALSDRLLGLPIAMRGLPRALSLSEDDAVMLVAMATGDRTYLTHSLRVGFERTGSFHMLVVSGLHLAILAGCLFWCALRLRIPSVPATLLTLVATFAYAVFTGFATPVQRSLWIITLYLIGRLVYREKSVLNTIGLASLCLLVVSPRSLFDSSLQMTLLAVRSIGGIAVPLMEKTIHPYLAATRDLRLTAIDSKLTPQLARFRVVLRMFATAFEKTLSKSVAWKIFPSGGRACD